MNNISNITGKDLVFEALNHVRNKPQYKQAMSDQAITRIKLVMSKIEQAINSPMTETNIEQVSFDLCEVIDLLK